MDANDWIKKEKCETRCGEIYLTVYGNMIFHCSLCGEIFKGFEDYVAHVSEHCQLEKNSEQEELFSEENSIDYKHNEDVQASMLDDFDPLNETKVSVEMRSSSSIDELETLKKKEKCHSGENESTNKSLKQPDQVAQNPKRNRKRPTTEQRIFKCIHCEFACNDKSNLIAHTRRHSTHRPHQCSVCPRAFYTRTELKSHIRTHTGERPFLCTDCGMAFTTASKLSLHSKKHTNWRDKQCSMCDMKFITMELLRSHMVRHSDDRPHKCDLCEATFKRRRALVNHKKLHENKREYVCKICLAGFNQGPGLYSHMKSKHAVAMEKMNEDRMTEDLTQ